MVVVVSNSCRVTDISKGVCITSFTFNDMTLALAFMTRFLSHPSQLGQLRLTLRRRMVFGVPGVSAISVGEVHVMVTRSMRWYDFFETPMRLTVQFTWLLFGLNVMVNHI